MAKKKQVRRAGPKTFVERVKKKKEKTQKVNVTFRLLTQVYEDFQTNCSKQGIGAGETIEEFMLDFNEWCDKS